MVSNESLEIIFQKTQDIFIFLVKCCRSQKATPSPTKLGKKVSVWWKSLNKLLFQATKRLFLYQSCVIYQVH